MKIEEAIETLEEKRKYCKMFYELSANPQEDYPSTAKFMDALELALTALRSMPEAGEPLNLEQLREMDGQPAYWPEDESWGIVSVDSAGKWAGKPFFKGRKQEVNFEYDIESRGMEVYAYPPAHIDRSEWKPCVDCRIKCRTCVVRGKEKCARCEKYSEYVPENNFCSNCGRPLTEEAWAELERRLRG